MPQIVTYDQRTQTPTGGADARVDAPGALIGDALERFGEQGQQTFGELAHTMNQDAAKKADLALVEGAQKLFHGGEQPLMDASGEAAAAAAQPTSQALTELYERTAKSLNPVARRMFDAVAHERLAGWQGDIARHSLQQLQTAQEDTAGQRRAQAIEAAARRLPDDPQRAMAELNVAHIESAAQSRLQGLDQAQTDARLRETTGQMLARAAAIQIPRDPHGAIRTLDEHGDLMDPGAADMLHAAARTSAAELDAGRHVEDAFVRIRPPLAPGVADILPADARPPLDPDDFADQCAERAGEDPGVQAAAWSLGRAKAAQANRAQAARVRDIAGQAQDAMAKGAVALADLPAQLRLAMGAATRQGFQRFAEAGGFAELTDAEAHGGHYALAADDPQAFLDRDLTGAAADMTSHDFAALAQDQATLRQGGPAADALRQRLGWIADAVDGHMTDQGLEPSDAPDLRARAISSLKLMSDLARPDGNRPLTRDDIHRLADSQDFSAPWNAADRFGGPMALAPISAVYQPAEPDLAGSGEDQDGTPAELLAGSGDQDGLGSDGEGGLIHAGWRGVYRGARGFLGYVDKWAEQAYDAYQAGDATAGTVLGLARAVRWPPDTAAARIAPNAAEYVFNDPRRDPSGRHEATLAAAVVDDRGRRLGTVWVFDSGAVFERPGGERRFFPRPRLPQLWNEGAGLNHQRAMAYIGRVDKLGPAVAKLFTFLLATPLSFGDGLMNDFAQDYMHERTQGGMNSPRDELDAWAIEAAFEARMAQMRNRSANPAQRPRVIDFGRVF